MDSVVFRTIFVSDIHLGTRHAQAEFFLDFLKNTESQYLYLVGDIIDLWKLKSGWYWPHIKNDIVRIILDKARKGTRVIYVPGNHDELLRDYVGTVFNGVHILQHAVHETADGRRLLVMHGDEFDSVILHSRWLAVVGSSAYDILLEMNRWYNYLRRRFGFPYWSLSAYLKHKVKNAVKHISNFETAVVREAARKDVHGMICGHIHKATLTSVHGMLYGNAGDWVESCTALVEAENGQLEILHWLEDSVLLLDQEAIHARGDRNRRLAPAD